MNKNRKMENFRYDPNNFEPHPKLNSDTKMKNEEIVNKSLSNYDSRLSFSEFESLNLHGTPRDTSKFYKHKQKNLYLRKRIIQGKIEWTNVTSHYEWDKIESNPQIPMFTFKKQNILTSCLKQLLH